MSFITCDKGRKYFHLLNAEAPSKKTASLHEFLGLDDLIISELLRPMLQVNPYFRPTAKELLKSKFFDDVRIPKYERSSPTKLSLEIDTDDLKDPETLQSKLSN